MAGVARILALLLVLGAAAGLAVAAVAAPGDPKRAFKSADQAFARTVLLTKSELPGKGWNGKATDFGGTNPPCQVAHYSLAKLTATAEKGTTFTRAVGTGTFLVESDVHVFLTSAQAGTAAATFSTLGFAKCLASQLVLQVPSGSFATPTVQKITVTGLAAPVTGVEIVLHIVSAKTKSTLTAMVLEIRRGRGLGTLSLLTAGAGWSQADVRAAAAKMARRLAARPA